MKRNGNMPIIRLKTHKSDLLKANRTVTRKNRKTAEFRPHKRHAVSTLQEKHFDNVIASVLAWGSKTQAKIMHNDAKICIWIQCVCVWFNSLHVFTQFFLFILYNVSYSVEHFETFRFFCITFLLVFKSWEKSVIRSTFLQLYCCTEQ